MPRGTYELILIVHPGVLPEEIQSTASRVEQILADQQGQLEKKEDWGKKRLAYPIAKQREGHYLFYQFQLDSRNLDEIHRNLRLTEKILKFQTVKQEAPRVRPPKERKKPQAAGAAPSRPARPAVPRDSSGSSEASIETTAAEG